MQPTYYERLLADERLQLAEILDGDIARLKAAGSLIPAVEDSSLMDCRSRYIKSLAAKIDESVSGTMSAEQFERYRHTPSYHEVLVQRASQQYWAYETFLFLRAHGERTVHVGAQPSVELLSTPLEAYGSDFTLEVPAAMLVFESPDVVDAFYAGERRSGSGRNHPEAAVCVLALELHSNAGSRARYLKILSVHGDARQDYRMEVRKLSLEDERALEDTLEDDDGNAWRGGEQIEQLLGLPACRLAWASRKADSGFYAAKTAYYRAVLGALHCLHSTPQRLSWHAGSSNGAASRLGYYELLASGV